MKAVHHGMIALWVASILLTSCNQDSGISDQQISDYIKTQIPPYLSVKSLTLERVAASPSGIAAQLYNFKVAATPEEPLFASTAFDFTAKQDLISKGLKEIPSGNLLFSGSPYDFKGLDQVQYLKQVNQTSDTITIYGTVGARKMVDKVEFGAFTVASGLENLGKPKGSFPPSSLIVGSAAYEEALNNVVKSQKEELAKAQATEAEKRASCSHAGGKTSGRSEEEERASRGHCVRRTLPRNVVRSVELENHRYGVYRSGDGRQNFARKIHSPRRSESDARV
jgi:hypothetical protein